MEERFKKNYSRGLFSSYHSVLSELMGKRAGGSERRQTKDGDKGGDQMEVRRRERGQRALEKPSWGSLSA